MQIQEQLNCRTRVGFIRLLPLARLALSSRTEQAGRLVIVMFPGLCGREGAPITPQPPPIHCTPCNFRNVQKMGHLNNSAKKQCGGVESCVELSRVQGQVCESWGGGGWRHRLSRRILQSSIRPQILGSYIVPQYGQPIHAALRTESPLKTTTQINNKLNNSVLKKKKKKTDVE